MPFCGVADHVLPRAGLRVLCAVLSTRGTYQAVRALRRHEGSPLHCGNTCVLRADLAVLTELGVLLGVGWPLPIPGPVLLGLGRQALKSFPCWPSKD